MILVAVASALALVACDVFLDLGQYHDCSDDCGGTESGVSPPRDSAAEAADATMPLESGVDAETGRDGGADADADADADASIITFSDSGPPVPPLHEIWAHWPMPNPDAALSDESSTALPNQMAYDAGPDAGSAVAYDAVTGLSWWRQALSASTYDGAWGSCLGLGAGPGGNWRVPTRIELVSLIDFTRVPTIQTATFLVAGAVTWTSSAVAGDESYWAVDFGSGLTLSSASPTQVICVSGGTP